MLAGLRAACTVGNVSVMVGQHCQCPASSNQGRAPTAESGPGSRSRAGISSRPPSVTKVTTCAARGNQGWAASEA